MTTFNTQTVCENGVTTVKVVALTGTDEGVGGVDLTVGDVALPHLDKVTAGDVVYTFTTNGSGTLHVHGQYFGLDGAKRNVSDQDVSWTGLPDCVVVTTTTTPETTTTAVVTTLPGETTTTAPPCTANCDTTTTHGTLPPTGSSPHTGQIAGGASLAIVLGAAAIIAAVRRKPHTI